MSTTPLIKIYVRHTPGCKYAADETSKRCACRKHLRWSQDGKQYRRKANTRSWAEAEQVKRDAEDQLSGRAQVGPADSGAKLLHPAIEIFITDKATQGLSASVIGGYRLLLGRLRAYCEGRGIYTVRGITADVLTEHVADWPTLYPSSITRQKRRERLRSFLRYCYEAQWLERVPPVTKFKVDEPETQPLTPSEYQRLLDAVYVTVGNGDPRRQTTENGGGRWEYKDAAKWQQAVYAFLQAMRWSGLAIGDTMTLRRSALSQDKATGIWRISTKRRKTDVPVGVPIPEHVARNLLAVSVGSPEYFFWSGAGKAQSATSNWGQRYIAPCFKAAGIRSEGNMLSHRLRDTFAVYLLEKGVPMEEVAKLLGNSLRVCEKHYAKWSKGRQDRADALVMETWATPGSGKQTKA